MSEKKKKNAECGTCNKICTDPQGSYTGVPENPNETPVQDVDDL
jgi:hypothetical protein